MVDKTAVDSSLDVCLARKRSLLASGCVILLTVLSFPVGLAAQEYFELNEKGASRLYWPFGPTSSWSERSETFNSMTAEWRTRLNGSHHNGSDSFAQDWNFGTKNDDLGHPLYAPGPGEILFIEREAKKTTSCKNSSYGRQIVMRFSNSNFGFRMAHLDEVSEKLQVGSQIRTGEYIGTLGHSGLANKDTCTSHLHAVLYSGIIDNSPQLARLMNGWRPQRSKKKQQLSAAFTFSAVKETASPREAIGPNLIVQRVEIDQAELKMGEGAVTHCTVKNDGNRSSTEKVKLKYVLSLDSNLDRRDMELGTDIIAPLRAGASVRNQHRFILPTAPWRGKLQLLCYVDSDGRQQELSEDDNIWGTELIIKG